MAEPVTIFLLGPFYFLYFLLFSGLVGVPFVDIIAAVLGTLFWVAVATVLGLLVR